MKEINMKSHINLKFKINIIENLLKIDNYEVINELQIILNNPYTPYSIEEYKNEIQEAENDIKNNKLISNEDLKVKFLYE